MKLNANQSGTLKELECCICVFRVLTFENFYLTSAVFGFPLYFVNSRTRLSNDWVGKGVFGVHIVFRQSGNSCKAIFHQSSQDTKHISTV